MAASFPGAVRTFTTKNQGDPIQSADCNDLQEEVNAIEAGYLSGTAQLNSSASTVATLSVTGGSTFSGLINVKGALQVNSSYGTAGQALVSQGSSQAAFVTLNSSPVKGYAVTPSTAANSSAEIDVLTMSMPASDMADGDILEVAASVLVSNSTLAGGVQFKWYWGTASATINSVNWGANSAVSLVLLKYRLSRQSTSIWVRTRSANNENDYDAAYGNLSGAVASNSTTMTGDPVFSSAVTVKMSVKLPATDAGLYFKVQSARAFKVASS